MIQQHESNHFQSDSSSWLQSTRYFANLTLTQTPTLYFYKFYNPWTPALNCSPHAIPLRTLTLYFCTYLLIRSRASNGIRSERDRGKTKITKVWSVAQSFFCDLLTTTFPSLRPYLVLGQKLNRSGLLVSCVWMFRKNRMGRGSKQ